VGNVEKQGVNGLTGEPVTATRRRLRTELELPVRDAYDAFIRERVSEATD
jgi:tRNA(His) guanylyltransferase